MRTRVTAALTGGLLAASALLVPLAAAHADDTDPGADSGTGTGSITITDPSGPVDPSWPDTSRYNDQAPRIPNPTTYPTDPLSQDVLDCLARHPDAVAAGDVTDGDDTVCVDQWKKGSPGNDTYIWVGADKDPNMALRDWYWWEGYGQQPDPGFDTVSMQDWSHGYDDRQNNPGLYGRQIQVSVEATRFTEHADWIGAYYQCGAPPPVNHVERHTYILGGGDDISMCNVGYTYGGEGDDTVIGVTNGGTADGGPGNDVIDGTADATDITLGDGNDIANVQGGTANAVADIVDGGAGTDTVYADPVDKVTSARVMLARVAPSPSPTTGPSTSPTPTPSPSASPTKTPTIVKCTWVKKRVKVWNKAKHRYVWKWTRVRSCKRVPVK